MSSRLMGVVLVFSLASSSIALISQYFPISKKRASLVVIWVTSLWLEIRYGERAEHIKT
jgi:uncharacterized membrane protein